jgi:ABC-type metal ion transport system substrate-binding protein
MQETGNIRTKDLLTKVLKKVKQLYNVNIRSTSKDKGLVLKFEGFSDYMLGNSSIKDFKRINDILDENLSFVSLVLTEIPAK